MPTVWLAIAAMGPANTAKHAGSELPLVCTNINIGNSTAKVKWYNGARTTTWIPCKRREGIAVVDWTEYRETYL